MGIFDSLNIILPLYLYYYMLTVKLEKIICKSIDNSF